MISSCEPNAPYDETALKQLEEQELVLRFPGSFGAREALRLGNVAVEESARYDRGVTVEIVRDSDGLLLFCWSAEDKAPRNLGFAEKKLKGSLVCGHSSLWGYVRRRLDGLDAEQAIADADKDAFYAGGAFPITDATGTRLATIALSGLHEGHDHGLAVDALAKALGVSAPPFSYAKI